MFTCTCGTLVTSEVVQGLKYITIKTIYSQLTEVMLPDSNKEWHVANFTTVQIIMRDLAHVKCIL